MCFSAKLIWMSLEGNKMEGMIFLVFWIGCAAFHTYYDLKIKPVLWPESDEQTDYPGF